MKLKKLKNIPNVNAAQSARHPPLNNSPYANYYLVEKLLLNSNSPPNLMPYKN